MRHVNIKTIATKISSSLKILEKRISVRLLVLMQRDDSMGNWDVVISSYQLSSGRMESYELVDQNLLDKLESDERMKISRIVIMDPDDPSAQFMMENLPFHSHHGYLGCQSSDLNIIADFLGFDIRNALLVRNLNENSA